MILIASLLMMVVTPSAAATTPSTRCIASSRIVTRHAATPDRLDLTLTGGRAAHLRLADACPHLIELDRPYSLWFDRREGDALCVGDRFRVVDPLVARSGGVASYPWCRVASLTMDGVRP